LKHVTLSMNKKTASKQALIYSLYCGGLYGTERMALATLKGLPKHLKKILICPPGEANKTAKKQGLITYTFSSKWQFIQLIIKVFQQNKNITIISSSVSHSIIFTVLSAVLLKKTKHFHIVHGGADELNSYQKKRVLRFFNIQFIAVSEFVKNKLSCYGINPRKISVIENFISTCEPVSSTHNIHWPPKKIILVSRLDPIKRLDLLVLLLEKYPALNGVSFTIYGTGHNINELQSIVKNKNLNITYAGYCSDIVNEIKKYDLFLHLCPDEPFGLVILEAMLAGVPVLVPNSGGPKDIIEHSKTGFTYKNTDIDDLAKQLLHISHLTINDIKLVINQAQDKLQAEYLTEAGISRYIKLINTHSSI